MRAPYSQRIVKARKNTMRRSAANIAFASQRLGLTTGIFIYCSMEEATYVRAGMEADIYTDEEMKYIVSGPSTLPDMEDTAAFRSHLVERRNMRDSIVLAGRVVWEAQLNKEIGQTSKGKRTKAETKALRAAERAYRKTPEGKAESRENHQLNNAISRLAKTEDLGGEIVREILSEMVKLAGTEKATLSDVQAIAARLKEIREGLQSNDTLQHVDKALIAVCQNINKEDQEERRKRAEDTAAARFAALAAARNDHMGYGYRGGHDDDWEDSYGHGRTTYVSKSDIPAFNPKAKIAVKDTRGIGSAKTSNGHIPYRAKGILFYFFQESDAHTPILSLDPMALHAAIDRRKISGTTSISHYKGSWGDEVLVAHATPVNLIEAYEAGYRDVDNRIEGDLTSPAMRQSLRIVDRREPVRVRG